MTDAAATATAYKPQLEKWVKVGIAHARSLPPKR
jgi:hypothetical protein